MNSIRRPRPFPSVGTLRGRPVIQALALSLPFWLFIVDSSAQGIITTVAGATGVFRSDSRPALNPPLGPVSGMVVDRADNLFVAAPGNHAVANTAAAPQGSPPAPSGARVWALTKGAPAQRQLAAGQVHLYRIRLAPNQYARVVFEQRGINLVVALVGANGKKLAEVDSADGRYGRESISLAAWESSSYRLEVRPAARHLIAWESSSFLLSMVQPEYKQAPQGRYEARVEELRQATPQDRSRVAAERALFAAEQLGRQEDDEAAQRNAITKFEEEALAHWRAAGDRAGEADALHRRGHFQRALALYRATGDLEGQAAVLESISHAAELDKERFAALRQALALWQKLGSPSRQAHTLFLIGKRYSSLYTFQSAQKQENLQKALDFFRQALAVQRTVADPLGEAALLEQIGYSFLFDNRRKLEFYQQALPLWRAGGDPASEAVALLRIGELYKDLGDKQNALTHYQQALVLVRGWGSRDTQANILLTLGRLYESLGEPAKALDSLGRALRLFRVLKDQEGGAAAALEGLGNVYRSRRDPQRALDSYNRALALFRTLEDTSGQASVLYGIGRLYQLQGEKLKALDFYNQALPLKQAKGELYGEGVTLYNLGMLYHELDQQQKALDSYQRSLGVWRSGQAGNRFMEAETLYALAQVQEELRDWRGALASYNQALTLFRSLENHWGQTRALVDIALIHNQRGENRKALDLLNQALQIQQADADRYGEALVLSAMGRVHENLGDRRKMLDSYLRSLELFRSTGKSFREADLLLRIGRAYEQMGDKEKASAFYGQARALEKR